MAAAEQVIVGLTLAVPSLTLGVLAYNRSRHVDSVSEQSGAVTQTREGTALVIDGLNRIIDTLQEDNKDWRDGFKELTIRLDSIGVERDELRKEVARLRKKYGDNGETPAKGIATTT